MLLKDLDDLKKYLGRAINKGGTSAGYIMPYVQLAQDEFLIPAIGREIIQELDTQYNAQPVALTPPNLALLAMLQRPLAFYGYHKYLPFAIGNDGENGLQEEKTEASEPVRIGLLDKRINETIRNAANGLETALLFLEQNADLYPTYKNSPAYQARMSRLIVSATELTTAMPLANGSYRLFLTLRPYLDRAEDTLILPVVGAVALADLKAKRKVNTLSGDEKTLLLYLNRAVATAAYAEALFHLNVVQSGGSGLRIHSEFDGINNAKAPDPALLQEARNQARSDAARAMTELRNYLIVNASKYPLIPPRAAGSAPSGLPDNSAYIGIFRLR